MTIFLICMIPLAASFGFATCALLQAAAAADRQEEKEAQSLATALEIYVTGSLNVFNHRTNVDVNNRLVC